MSITPNGPQAFAYSQNVTTQERGPFYFISTGEFHPQIINSFYTYTAIPLPFETSPIVLPAAGNSFAAFIYLNQAGNWILQLSNVNATNKDLGIIFYNISIPASNAKVLSLSYASFLLIWTVNSNLGGALLNSQTVGGILQMLPLDFQSLNSEETLAYDFDLIAPNIFEIAWVFTNRFNVEQYNLNTETLVPNSFSILSIPAGDWSSLQRIHLDNLLINLYLVSSAIQSIVISHDLNSNSFSVSLLNNVCTNFEAASSSSSIYSIFLTCQNNNGLWQHQICDPTMRCETIGSEGIALSYSLIGTTATFVSDLEITSLDLNFECTSPTPFCSFLQCQNTSSSCNCSPPKPVCSNDGVCVECLNNNECVCANEQCINQECQMECQTNSDCPKQNPICYLESHSCGLCRDNSDCSLPTSFCYSDNGECGGCLFNSECNEGFECSAASQLCVPVVDTQCHKDSDCSNILLPICSSTTGVCEGCQTNKECKDKSSQLPICLINGECGGCTTSQDCPSDYLCIQNSCQLLQPCFVHCRADAPYCLGGDQCVKCITNEECETSSSSSSDYSLVSHHFRPFVHPKKKHYCYDYQCVQCINNSECCELANCIENICIPL